MEMIGDVTDAGQTNEQKLKIELISRWKLEAESCNLCDQYLHLDVRILTG